MEQNGEPRNKSTPSYLINNLTEEARTYNWLKIVYSINSVGKIGQIHVKSEIDHLLTSHTRINSKWVKNVKVRHETIKILEENIGSKILDIAQQFLSDISPQARETKEKNK